MIQFNNSECEWVSSERLDCFIGTTAALIGMAIASAAGSTAKAVIDSKASSKAAATQVAATKTVQQKQDQLYADYQAQMQPYLNTGKSAVNLLGSLMQVPGTPGAYSPAGAAPPNIQRPLAARSGGAGPGASVGGRMNPWGPRMEMPPQGPMGPPPPPGPMGPPPVGPPGQGPSQFNPWMPYRPMA
jgi:hypothetical protein